ncbi:MAG: hypothetical protein ACRYF3_02075, partial [Janthinobacterium lividum]
FLDSDDLWFDDALHALHAALDARPDAVGVSATADLVDERSTPIEAGLHAEKMRQRLIVRHGRLGVLPTGADTTFESLAVAGRIFPPAVALLRGDAVRAVGGFDTALTIGEDWDLFLRVCRQGPLVFLDRNVAWYRRHASSSTAGDPGRTTYQLDLVRHKAWTSPENTPSQRAAVRTAWRAVQLAATAARGRAAVAALLRRTPGDAYAAGRDTFRFGVGLLANRPPQPQRHRAHQRSAMVAVVQPRPGRRAGTP